jgi:hypothetical protein
MKLSGIDLTIPVRGLVGGLLGVDEIGIHGLLGGILVRPPGGIVGGHLAPWVLQLLFEKPSKCCADFGLTSAEERSADPGIPPVPHDLFVVIRCHAHEEGRTKVARAERRRIIQRHLNRRRDAFGFHARDSEPTPPPAQGCDTL